MQGQRLTCRKVPVNPLLSFELPPAMSDVQRLLLLVVATLPNGHRPISAI